MGLLNSTKITGSKALTVSILTVTMLALGISAPVHAVTTTCSNHSDTIPAFTDNIYVYYFPGALSGWAYLDSSSGPVGFSYYFSNNQFLYVIISNGNSYSVYATWTTCFMWN
jgi:hypothetical protein